MSAVNDNYWDVSIAFCGIRKCAIEKGVETCGACASMDSCSLLGAIVANNEEARGNLTRNGRD